MQRLQNLKQDQRGIVSVMLTIFVMLMLTLTVLAFSQTTRREQRQALDHQISTQAFYAAESGINETANLIRKATATTPLRREQCSDVDASKDLGDGISYSCVLYDAAPKTLEYTNIGEKEGKLIPLETEGGGSASSISLAWNVAGYAPNAPLNYGFCPGGSSAATVPNAGCDAGVLRAEIITTGAGLNREKLYESSYTVYFNPSSGGTASVSYQPHQVNEAGAAGQGRLVPVTCSNIAGLNRCRVKIDSIPTSGKTLLQIRSIYKANSVTIKNESSPATGFTKAQFKIDSTGKVADVLRRLQVRQSYFDDFNFSSFSIDSYTKACKRLVMNSSVPDTSGNPDPNAGNEGPVDAVVADNC